MTAIEAKSSIPTCAVTGAIPGDGGACGDCDPCIMGEASVPEAVKRLIAEKNSLIRRNAELEDAQGWQPIEFAPKDGSMVLLAGRGWIDAGSWRVSLNGEKDEGWTCEWVKSWGYEEYAYCKPTHWMPLPAPPMT